MEAIRLIEAAAAEIVFVSLGCPKQESWMAVHKPHVKAVMLGVGAAFDFAAGSLSRAPRWMQRSGLEWLYRVMQEPGRMWKRYLVTNTLFAGLAIRELLGIGRNEQHSQTTRDAMDGVQK